MIFLQEGNEIRVSSTLDQKVATFASPSCSSNEIITSWEWGRMRQRAAASINGETCAPEVYKGGQASKAEQSNQSGSAHNNNNETTIIVLPQRGTGAHKPLERSSVCVVIEFISQKQHHFYVFLFSLSVLLLMWLVFFFFVLHLFCSTIISMRSKWFFQFSDDEKTGEEIIETPLQADALSSSWQVCPISTNTGCDLLEWSPCSSGSIKNNSLDDKTLSILTLRSFRRGMKSPLDSYSLLPFCFSFYRWFSSSFTSQWPYWHLLRGHHHHRVLQKYLEEWKKPY